MLVGCLVSLAAAPMEIYSAFWTHQAAITENSWFQVTAFKRLCTSTEKLLLCAGALQRFCNCSLSSRLTFPCHLQTFISYT